MHSDGPSGCGAGESVRDLGRKRMEQAMIRELSVDGGIKTSPVDYREALIRK